MLEQPVLRAKILVEGSLYLDYPKIPTTVLADPDDWMTTAKFLSMADLSIMTLVWKNKHNKLI